MFALVLSALTPLLAGQQARNPANPDFSGSSFSTDALAPQQLIAWTWMQSPQPMPQPVPPDNGAPQPGRRQSAAAMPPSQENTETSARNETGKETSKETSATSLPALPDK
jgi:hypothetical protein